MQDKLTEQMYEWTQQVYVRPNGQPYKIQRITRKATGKIVGRRIVELTDCKQLRELLRRVHPE